MAPKIDADNSNPLEENDDANKYLFEKRVIFGENVRAARKSMGFTSEALGKFVDISPAYVGLIERGIRTPSLEIFIRLSEFFGESTGGLLEVKNSNSTLREIGGEVFTEARTSDSKELKISTISNMLRTFNMDELEHIKNVIKSFKFFCKRNDVVEVDPCE